MKKSLALTFLAVVAGGMPAFGASLIVNEYNAVGEGKILGSGGQDTFFNPNYPGATGNGGNWMELVVTQDHLDIRGWTISWTNADPDSGNVMFTANSLWADLRSGTIITLREDDAGDVGTPVGARPSDTSFNPGSNDFWLEINVDDAAYMVDGGFKVDNDDWVVTVLDDTPLTVQGPLGEPNVGPYSGGGVNSQEAVQLSVNPTASPIAAGYIDVSRSSYGAPNWLNASGSSVQDFAALRTWVNVPEPSSFALAAFAASGAATVLWRRRRRGR